MSDVVSNSIGHQKTGSWVDIATTVICQAVILGSDADNRSVKPTLRVVIATDIAANWIEILGMLGTQ